MTQTNDPSLIIAYYRNPKTNRVEKHLMQTVIFEEASRPMMVGNERVTSGEEDLWTLEPPEDIDPREIQDLTPQPFVTEVASGQPPPAFPTRAPEILKRAQTAPAAPQPRRKA
jgi:hypothetical protein